MAQEERQGFRTHLVDAIRLNTARMPLYMERTAGRSRGLSEELISTERLCLPLAAYFDWRGKYFERAGLPVVSGSFVPMDTAAADAPTVYSGQADATAVSYADTLLRDLGRQTRAALRNADFAAVAQACEEALLALDRVERDSLGHFAMSKHLVESLGLGALNGLECAHRSSGRTTALAHDLVWIQVLALGKAADADRRAQELHAMGAGILVNDMPAIPFLERWHASAL